MKKRLKKLTYRDISGKTAQQIASEWRGYQFQAGPVVCKWHGKWGQVQVWAATAEEGRAVLQKALICGGWSSQAIANGQFTAVTAAGGRNGRTGTMRTAEGRGLIGVSKRQGPSGSPTFAES